VIGNQVPRGLSALCEHPLFADVFRLQGETLERFYGLAGRLSPPDCPLAPPPPALFELRRNFFSTLFLGAIRVVVPASRYLPLYAMVNQGMRAWVTACDNLLDDEYKSLFEFQVAGTGPRMRSVLTLMLAERVVNAFILETYGDPALVQTVGRVTYAALMPSALQECEEETRPVPVLPVARILEDVHRRKTGDLFQAPLALPLELERPSGGAGAAVRQALGAFGLACQILDDTKDMPEDVLAGRHNLLVSLVARHRGGDPAWLTELRRSGDAGWDSAHRFAPEHAEALELARAQFHLAFETFAGLGVRLPANLQFEVMAGLHELLGVAPPAASRA
jgi:hypothetical protein